jgi:hypothetical protein
MDSSDIRSEGQRHDNYGKAVLEHATESACRSSGPSVITSYGSSSARIDGTVGSNIAVEIESRTGKQVRGAILDLILHAFPKKLMILIPKYIGKHQVQECEFILRHYIEPQNFRVVLLNGSGHDSCLEADTQKVRSALQELGWMYGNDAGCSKSRV